MDIFKLFFEHDIRLDKTVPRGSEERSEEPSLSIEEFMKPIPTCSKFYITGTRMEGEDERFGLDVLGKSDEVLARIDSVFEGSTYSTEQERFESLQEALDAAGTGEAIAISDTPVYDLGIALSRLRLDEETNVGHLKMPLRELLQEGIKVLYKEQAHHGFDLHIFSKDNIYESLFYAFKELIAPDFRFFSINSKRMRSERHFYFETWSLEKPPHGAEEVLPETTL